MSFNAERTLKRYLPEEKEAMLSELLSEAVPRGDTTPKLVNLKDTIEEAKTLMATGDKLNGLSTGYKAIDRMTRGLAAGEVIVLFGGTSHGKSQLAQNITLNLAKADVPVLFISLEMTNAENTQRFMLMNNSDDPLPIIYPVSSDITYEQVDKIVKEALKQKIGLVVIDHLHMFARNIDNAANEISVICKEFKQVALRNGIPLILISHINRKADKNGPPSLQELKGSSSIEQDADIALAVWRDMNNDDQTLVVANRKNRNRGRKLLQADLAILDNLRLAESIDLSSFPKMA